MKVMIHACIDRARYVNSFLVPFLLRSGYDVEDVFIYVDPGLGCLKGYIDSFKNYIPDNNNSVWHLQDDVLPRYDFYNYTEYSLKYFLEDGIICGFGNKEFYTKDKFGYVYTSADKFYSFPCIRIPNHMCHEFVTWFEEKATKKKDLETYINANKYVDYLFKLFVDYKLAKHEFPIFNHKPCLVEHVDEYVGGSMVNKERKKKAKALEFDDKVAMRALRDWKKREECNE